MERFCRTKIDILLNEIEQSKPFSFSKIAVGSITLTQAPLFQSCERVIYLTPKGLSHLARPSKRKRFGGLTRKEILRIPLFLAAPDFIFKEEKRKKGKRRRHLLFVSLLPFSDKAIKIVVDPCFIQKGKEIAVVITAGRVYLHNLLNNKQLELVFQK